MDTDLAGKVRNAYAYASGEAGARRLIIEPFTDDAALGAFAHTEEPAPPRGNREFHLDLRVLSAARLLEGEIELVNYLYKNSCPQGVSGAIVGPPGVGKSFAALQLLVAKAIGSDDLLAGLVAHEPGSGPAKVFGLFCEDDDRILAQRLRAILARYSGGWADDPEEVRDVRALVAANLLIVSGVGRNSRLLEVKHGQPRPTQFYGHLLDSLKDSNVELVILDCQSRLFGGDENNPVHATFFVELIEQLAAVTGATVLVLHHVRKPGKSTAKGREAIADRLGMEQARGSGGFAGAYRWALSFTDIRENEAASIGADPSVAWQFAAARVSMTNNGQGGSVKFLRRDPGGVLVAHKPSKKSRAGL